MGWNVSADPTDNEEAIAWLRSRVPLTDEEWQKLTGSAKRKAFKVAGVAQIDIIADTLRAAQAAVANGTTLADFKKTIGPKLEQAWAGSVDNPAWRLETIFRTNVQSAYGAGRWRQMKAPAVTKYRPYWQLDTVKDLRQSDICKAFNDPPVILPHDDPFWDTHTPPLHHNCRSGIRSLRKSQAEAAGITEKAPDVDAAKGFGGLPDESEWDPDPKAYPPELAPAVQKVIDEAPAATAGPAVEGVHFKKLVTNASKAKQQNAIDALNDEAILEFLAREPINELRLKKSVGRNLNGWYQEATKNLAVRTERTKQTFGQDMRPGESWSVSAMAKDAAEAVRRTFIHELGHHVHLTGSKKIDQVIRDAFATGRAGSLTAYGRKNYKEYFAEAFAAYRFHNDDLAVHDPNAFTMVEEVLRLRGFKL